MKYSQLPIKTKEKIVELSQKHGWKFVMKEYPYMVRLTKKFNYSLVKMNIYWNASGVVKNVCTHMSHPKKGKGQVYRKVRLSELGLYFKNPRHHSNKGYGRSINK